MGGWGSSPDTLTLPRGAACRQTAAAQHGSVTLSAFCPYHQQQRGCQGITTAARRAAAPALGCESQPPPPAPVRSVTVQAKRCSHPPSARSARCGAHRNTRAESPHTARSEAALTLLASESREGSLGTAASPRPLSPEGRRGRLQSCGTWCSWHGAGSLSGPRTAPQDPPRGEPTACACGVSPSPLWLLPRQHAAPSGACGSLGTRGERHVTGLGLVLATASTPCGHSTEPASERTSPFAEASSLASPDQDVTCFVHGSQAFL